jgi:hypothetical protein
MTDEEQDYFVEGLIDAWYNGPKTLNMRLKLREILVEMKEKADIYAKQEDFDDMFMEQGMERLLTEFVQEIYRRNGTV